jgi:hypothetical protein
MKTKIKEIKRAAFHFKRSAVPEYIWYISLIIISITLVIGIANIAKKSNKNVEPPSNVNVQFDVVIDPNNVVKIKTLNFIGQWDLEKDTPNLYLKCGNSSKNLMELFLAKKVSDLFVRKASGEIGLKAYDGLILGKNGKAMLFDGKTGYIEVPFSNDFRMDNNEVTLVAIVKPFPKTNNKMEDIIGRGEGCWEEKDYSLSIKPSPYFRFHLGSEDEGGCSTEPEGYYKIDDLVIEGNKIDRPFYNNVHILIGSASKTEKKFFIDGIMFKEPRDLTKVPDLIAYVLSLIHI